MRTFVDESGAEWTVWEVRPMPGTGAMADRRGRADRRSTPAPDPIVERRRGGERRSGQRDWTRGVAAALTAGWLAFDAGAERRRLAPVPANWDSLPDAELVALWRTAAAATPRAARDG